MPRSLRIDSVSVAMCTYNGALHLQEQLASLTQQTRRPMELVVCDDGSTDATLSILNSFARTASFPVQIHRNPVNLKSTKNFEQAVRLCRGNYIALCDQDDWWCPHKLQTLLASVSESNAGGAFSDGLLMNEQSVLTGGTIWKAHRFGDLSKAFGKSFSRQDAIAALIRENVVTGSGLMFRSSLREYLLPFPSEWLHDGWLAWMLTLHASLRAVKEPLFRYRVHVAQQVGVPDYSPAHKLSSEQRKLEARRLNYESQIRQLERLAEYVQLQPALNEPGLIRRIEGKCRHLHNRAEREAGRLERWLQIIAEAAAYAEYSQGWKSMLLDALV